MVSIIIPTYNRADILSETLDSILLQKFEDWECIIVDDGSTDSSQEIINKYIKADSRFKFYNRPSDRSKGANVCRNFGLEKARGEYINWFDSDDIMHSNFLKHKVEILERNISLDFCACISKTFSQNFKDAEVIERPRVMNSDNYIEDYLINGLYFYTPSPLWRSTFLKGKKCFDETLYRSQERDFHFRMLTFNPKFIYIDKVLFYVRTGSNSITNSASSSLQAQKSVFKYFNGVFDYLKRNKNLNNRDVLMKYVFYRQATNYYNINQLCTSVSQRFNILLSHIKYLIDYVRSLKGIKRHFIKITIGLFFLLIFKKGYKYFYFPEYNYAKK